ncbi:ferroxidase fet3 [Coemansia sp. RSA 1722]|nr:ferroxidase fet3 [Coemansia sp. RSA 485]KAJ2602639.1 ferroxidase fet3 [Coemansia sp. RSA 1722]
MSRALSTFSLFVFLSVASAARIVHNWEVGAVHVDRAGAGARYAIGVNGRLPLPLVRATLGDVLVFNVKNSLSKPTTLHIHGYFFNGTSFYDGADMISSCSIAPNTTFTYEIPAVQAGTYWIHGHTNHENADGLRGPLIVDRPNEPFQYKDERLFVFEDWYSMPFAERLSRSIEHVESPRSLINGIDARQAKELCLAEGTTYRIRLLNIASTAWYEFALENHEMQVIELDGVLCKRSPVRSVRLAPAQRVSVLVTAHAGPSSADYDRYTVRQYFPHLANQAEPPAHGADSQAEDIYGSNIVVKQASPSDSPLQRPSWNWHRRRYQQLPAFSDIRLVPLSNKDNDDDTDASEDSLSTPDRRIRLELGSGRSPDGRTHSFINGIAFSKPRIPAIYTALTAGGLAMDPRVYGEHTNTVVLKSMEVIELVLWNNSTMAHPMHLHGHTFQLYEYGCTDAGHDECGSKNMAFKAGSSPMRRDTVSVGPFQYAVIRFKASNPGMWLMHCHIDTHHAQGMAMLFAEAPEVLQQTPDMPLSVRDQCLLQGVATSVNSTSND